ncbi:MAG: rod shape-determining protein MreC [Candidatus Omnitrophica bacterium]|nr:rod shape-determining protein MreC [Candidatus Omnitrophota bacterium]MBU1869960.1 rod shape-determining protein MreC [Candidatus Omnitrophota bacterium]
MFKFKNKYINYAAVITFFLALALINPAVRVFFSNVCELPLNLVRFVGREVDGAISYHRNYVLNEKLKNQIDLLNRKIVSLNEVILENQRLKRLLSLKESASYKVILSKVIARAPDSWSSVIMIDKGSANGIKKGMVALSYLGLLGRVTETTDSVSKIILMNDPNFCISALIQRTRQEGLVCGTLGVFLIMRYLPEGVDVKKGDLVVTSGLNPNYPKGLLIGRVVDMGKEFSGLSRYVTIKPATNLSDIEEVLVIAK